MKKFSFKQTHHDEYYFDIEAKDKDEAFMKLKDLKIEDATGHKKLDIYNQALDFGNELTDEEREEHQVVPDILGDAKVANYDNPTINK